MVALQELRLAAIVATAGILVAVGAWAGWRLAQPPQAPKHQAIAKPSASPTPQPQAQAAAAGRARVIIERVRPQAHAGQPSPAETQGGEVWGERIIIEADAGATAEVAQPTPAPSSRPAPGPLGLVVGTMPGRVGASWQLLEAQPNLPGNPSVGISAIAGPESAGVAGTLGQDDLLPGLRLQAGAAQAYREPFGPQPFVGVGVRF